MRSIACPLQYNAENLKNHVFAIQGDTQLTYEKFYHAVRSTAEYLKALDIPPQSKVALFSANTIELLIICYALWRNGVITCLLNTRLPEETINSQLKQINARILFTSVESLLQSPNINIKKIDLNKSIRLHPSLTDEIKKFEFNLEQPATIIFTSGSTDKPKAVLHSLGNHFFNAKGSNENIPVSPKDRWMLSLPLYHAGGLSIIFRVLLGKGTVVIPDSKDALDETILKNKVTHISLVPTQLYRLIEIHNKQDALKNLKAILIGGSSISDTLLKKAIYFGLPVYITYGSTEMSSQIATSEKLTEQEPFRKAKLLNYRELKIDENNEICVKGPTLFQGYVNGDDVKLPLDNNGWFKTGDLGHLADRQYLTVYGRKDNMFISGGENIQPEEIEYFLCQTEEIEQAIVVPIKNEEFGHRPVAFVRIRPHMNFKRENILKILQNNLPKYKIPEQFYAWPKEWDIQGLKENRKRLTELAEHKNPDLKIMS